MQLVKQMQKLYEEHKTKHEWIGERIEEENSILTHAQKVGIRYMEPLKRIHESILKQLQKDKSKYKKHLIML